MVLKAVPLSGIPWGLWIHVDLERVHCGCFGSLPVLHLPCTDAVHLHIHPGRLWNGTPIALALALSPLCSHTRLPVVAFQTECPRDPIFENAEYRLPSQAAFVSAPAAGTLFGSSWRFPVDTSPLHYFLQLGLGATVTFRPVLLHVLFMAVFASLIAPFGGFFASGLKRAFKIKDFDNLIPGHGGVVDRFDCQLVQSAFANAYYVSFIKVRKGGVC